MEGPLLLTETMRVAYDTFCANKVRFALTALGMVIGTASLILVTTIGLTGKQYILNQIQAIGANMIYAYQEGGGSGVTTTAAPDPLTVDDMVAVQQQVPGIQAASPMTEMRDRISVGSGKERDILVLGVAPDYRAVRNLVVLAGRFFDEDDTRGRAKVAVITQDFAKRMFSNEDGAIGQTVKVAGLPFVIVGVFKERVETFGQSELASDTIVIPYTVARYFSGTDAVRQIFFSTADAGDVPRATDQIKQVLQARHRPESVYRVENLTQLLDVADKSAQALTLVLLLVATVTLMVGGVGIMNIMLVTVRSRTREIGIRKAIGATSRAIRWQFLTEAIIISAAGGVIGTILGLALPLSVRFFTSFRIPISGLSAIIAITVSSLVGILFGTLPAARAAELDPVEALRYE
jgi:putative ABC transport system permease protein